MVRNNKHNTDPLLRSGREFIGEFGDAFEIEVVGRGDSHLEKDGDIVGECKQRQWLPGLMTEEPSIDSETGRETPA